MTDERISTLLRLKRFEQPPAGYFDRMLAEIHRRQRAELLRRPLWKIAVERIQVFFGEHSMGHLSYAAAMAAVLVAGVLAIGLMTPGEMQNRNQAVAKSSSAMVPSPAVAPGGNRMLVLGPTHRYFTPVGDAAPPSPASLISSPRYVIDARPVSYEPAPSFSF
jgi:hypothetical protein